MDATQITGFNPENGSLKVFFKDGKVQGDFSLVKKSDLLGSNAELNIVKDLTFYCLTSISKTSPKKTDLANGYYEISFIANINSATSVISYLYDQLEIQGLYAYDSNNNYSGDISLIYNEYTGDKVKRDYINSLYVAVKTAKNDFEKNKGNTVNNNNNKTTNNNSVDNSKINKGIISFLLILVVLLAGGFIYKVLSDEFTDVRLVMANKADKSDLNNAKVRIGFNEENINTKVSSADYSEDIDAQDMVNDQLIDSVNSKVSKDDFNKFSEEQEYTNAINSTEIAQKLDNSTYLRDELKRKVLREQDQKFSKDLLEKVDSKASKEQVEGEKLLNDISFAIHDKYIADNYKNTRENKDNISKNAGKIKNSEKRISSLERKVANYKGKLADLRKRLDILKEMYENQEITLNSYNTVNVQINKEVSWFSDEITQINILLN